jgi:EAL and modified HD-GYP domain-containing signal transduction protein
MEKFFLGRQPILNREQKTYGFELLFRAANSLFANVTDYSQASASVILDSLTSFNYQELLGRHYGFFNVNENILMDDALELIPRDQAVIELLETIEITDTIVNRCHELKEKGFRLALDDHDYGAAFEPLYEIVDFIKVDVLGKTPNEIAEQALRFRPWKLPLLAEKVETHEVYQICHDLGFAYFQGYYFAVPTVLKQAKVDMSSITLLKLFNQLLKEMEIKEIEETFKQSPPLTYNLLRLVNSVGMGLRVKIKTLRHALTVLGRRQLIRWVQLALFAAGDPRRKQSPLLELASMRGRLLELLVFKEKMTGNVQEYADKAFMTGILSLVDVLFETSMEEVVSQLNVDEDVRDALMTREGKLGGMLSLSERLEQSDFQAVAKLLARLGIRSDNLIAAQLEAIQWTNAMDEHV